MVRRALVVALLLLGITGAAHAVGTNPADWTPQVTGAGGTVQQIAPCGGSMWAAGDFATITAVNGTKTRRHAFAFGSATGLVWDFAPTFNGPTHSVTMSSDCRTVWYGGDFTAVNGQPAAHIVALNAQTGTIIPGFARNANAPVKVVLNARGHIIVGGQFTSINGSSQRYFVSLNPTTGLDDGWIRVPISGTYGPGWPTSVYDVSIAHVPTRMLVNGTFTSVSGVARKQVFMLNLWDDRTAISPWYSPEIPKGCTGTHTLFYAVGIAWDTADQVLIASTGYKNISKLCDSLVRIPSTATPNNAVTLWNRTGCDSLYAVTADVSAYYVGGHQRYMDNPLGCDGPGPGAVTRYGIAAVDRYTGKATAWNPSNSRGHGVEQLLVTSAGLWAVGDAARCGPGSDSGGGEYRPGVCFLPN